MLFPPIETPVVTLEEVVRPEWIDGNGHMGAVHYANAFGAAMTEFLARLGLSERTAGHTGRGVFLLDWRIAYLREVRDGTPIRVDVRLLDVSDKLLHYFFEMRAGAQDYLAATSEGVEIHMDLGARRSAPFEAPVKAYLGRMLEAHRALPWPDSAGRGLGIRR